MLEPDKEIKRDEFADLSMSKEDIDSRVSRLEEFASTRAKARAYLENDQSIGATTMTKIAFNKENFDPSDSFNNTDYTFNAPITGFYLVIGHTSGLTGTLYVYKNGVATEHGLSTFSNDGNESILAVDIIFMEERDYIDLRIYSAAGGDAVGGDTFIAVHLLSMGSLSDIIDL